MSEYRVELPAHSRGGARRRAARVLAGVGMALLLAAGAYSTDANANVYEWKDSQNQLHYTDRPPPPGATLVSIRPSFQAARRPVGDGTATEGGAEAPRPAAPRPAANANAQQQAARSQVQQDLAAKRAEQCVQAGERYKKYIESRQLYREGENGERVYLSEQELEEARVNAKRELDAICAEAER